MVKVAVPKTFIGRKRLEFEAFRIARGAFAQLGWKLEPLALDRETVLPLDRLSQFPVLPLQLLFLVALPDAIAVCEPQKVAFMVELKSTIRKTVSIRCRDLLAIQAWNAAICVVHLSTKRVFASFANELEPPERIIVPRKPTERWDILGLQATLSRYPEVPVATAIGVEAGSKAPFGVWRLSAFAPLDALLSRYAPAITSEVNEDEGWTKMHDEVSD
ncbi:MAG: hypothetical protein N3B10_06390 [Armatimonadetes bacterium]|nr:hypothetical protein [Armatimonadota bacterium]